MIAFESSTFSGSESSGVISATVIISGGIISSRDISVPVTFTPGTATGYLNASYNCDWIFELIFLYLKTRRCKCYALNIIYIKLHR